MSEADHQLVGKIGRAMSDIAPGELGEVMIPVRGGSESFYAYGSLPSETIPKGERVIVIEHEHSRTVVVARYP